MKYGMNFQDMISALNHYWTKQGCVLVQPYDVEKAPAPITRKPFSARLPKNPSTVRMWKRSAVPQTAATAKTPTAWANITNTR